MSEKPTECYPIKIVKGVLAACDELMAEFIAKKRAANWKVINDGLYAAEQFLRQAGVKRERK